MKLTFVLVAALVSCVLAQAPDVGPPQPCYMSKLFTTDVYQTFFYEESFEINTGTLFFNIPSKLVRFDVIAGVENFGGAEVSYSISVFQNYNTGTSYVFDHSDNTCSSVPLTTSLGSGELPSDSTYSGQILIGSQPIQEFFYPNQMGSDTFSIQVGVTAGGCQAYNVDVYNSTIPAQPTLILAEAFWNYIPSVSPFVFDPPAACTNNLVHFLHLSEEVRRKATLAIHALEMHNLAL